MWPPVSSHLAVCVEPSGLLDHAPGQPWGLEGGGLHVSLPRDC
jgi:hypothetical protein